jgi:hypothetical protein
LFTKTFVNNVAGKQNHSKFARTMAERDPPQSSGFLSGVFTFVSREIEGFLTTATGGTLSDSEATQACPRFNSLTCCELTHAFNIGTTKSKREK